MSRQEQIRNKARELGQKYFPDETNIWARSNVEAAYVENACVEMAQWADQHPNWISVEEELPPKMDKWTKASDYVLVYTNEGEWLIGRYWHDGDGWSVSGFIKAKVTHWMPIVPPRKEE